MRPWAVVSLCMAVLLLCSEGGVKAQQGTSCTILFDFESNTQGWYTDSSSGATSISTSSSHAVSSNRSGKLEFSNTNKAIFNYQPSNSMDFSSSKVQFDLWKSGNPTSVAIALITGSGQKWIESTPQNLADGANTITFDPATSNWKSEDSGWAYSTSVPNVNQVARIAIILLSDSQASGKAYIDNLSSCRSTSTVIPSVAPPPSQGPVLPPSGNVAFVSANGQAFSWGKCPFYYAGTNNYYVTYQSKTMVNDVMDAAKSMGMTVMRIWGFIDRGSLDGSVPDVDGAKNGIYFQYWDKNKQQPAYNNGADGLEKLDYALAEAAKRGIKLIVTLTNNWKEFGGMDQYCKWYGLSTHAEFYTDKRVKDAYKAWASHLINRKNTITGVVYKEDPTIFAWELANEPRCNNGNLGSSGSCNTNTITTWVQEMSAYIKSLDNNHMVSVGDEGFFNKGGSDWIENGSEGIDFDALLSVSTIDFGTFHLYPSHWGKSIDWGVDYINAHIASSKAKNKPVIAEEFGYPSDKASVYTKWTSAMERGLAGDNYWMIAGKMDDGQLYPDYDGFTVYNDGSAAANVLKQHAANMAGKNKGCTRTGVLEVDLEQGGVSPAAWIVPLVVVVVAAVMVATLFVFWKKRKSARGDLMDYQKMPSDV